MAGWDGRLPSDALSQTVPHEGTVNEQGSLIVHLDYAVHYVKVLLDDIFGSENFRNEIAWCYGGGGAAKGLSQKA